jgi:hypothetical protein
LCSQNSKIRRPGEGPDPLVSRSARGAMDPGLRRYDDT